jgi:hypothetical protein
MDFTKRLQKCISAEKGGGGEHLLHSVFKKWTVEL